MPVEIRDNMIEELIKLIKLVREFRDDQKTHSDAILTKERFSDIDVHLCEIMSSMIASPLTGRIFLPPPDFYVQDDVRQASIKENFCDKI